MNSVSKVQFGQLNDKRFYFCDGISIPYGHPLLEIWERKTLNIETFIVLLKKKEKLSECEVVKKNTSIRYYKTNTQSNTSFIWT